MTKKEALQILIDSSCRDIEGQGLGYRKTTDEWRVKVSTAIAILYKNAYGRYLSSNEAFNRRLSISDSTLAKYEK
jgi:hypothetical protein